METRLSTDRRKRETGLRVGEGEAGGQQMAKSGQLVTNMQVSALFHFHSTADK